MKIASLSLAALLALSSPAIAARSNAAPEAAKAAKCTPPEKFPAADRIEGADLKKLRELSAGLPEQVDLVLLLKNSPVAVAFVKGCAVGYGVIELAPKGAPKSAPKSDDGSI
jgi:hypothetical protein